MREALVIVGLVPTIQPLVALSKLDARDKPEPDELIGDHS